MNVDFVDFKKVADYLFIPIHITDKNTKILYVNSAYETLSGLHRKDIIGKTTVDLEGELYFGSVSERVATEKKRIVSSAVCYGSGKENVVVGTPIFDDNGEIELVVVNNLDFPKLLDMRKNLEELKEESLKTQTELDYLRSQQTRNTSILYKSDEIENIIKIINMIAPTDVSILITGETGTGKELIADKIYNTSERVNKPFIKINCTTIPTELLESELFGYDTGAFSGAKKGGKMGLFELAHTGTILLDEIGDIPFNLQGKLLRVLQQKNFRRVGGITDIPVDIRVIASTNVNLKEAVKEGKFREDLYYRLNVVPLEIPPLRERKEDIPFLATNFCQRFCRKYNKSTVITESGISTLLEYNWPGNIRELENIIERLIITDITGTITGINIGKALGIKFADVDIDIETVNLKTAVKEFELSIINKAIAKHGSIRKAAKTLGVDHSTLVKKLKYYNNQDH